VSSAGDVDYYKLLQLPRSASQIDIINAYRHAKLAYQEDSLAIYSLFNEQELDAIREQVEQAYHVLSDPERRQAYDAMFEGEAEDQKPEMATDNVIPFHGLQARPSLVEQASESELETDYHYDGTSLKRIREAKGISLESIATYTRISKRYLQAIEDENVDHFPEMVYLKGYLRQYGQEIGVDPEKLVVHYLESIADKREEQADPE
jgi:curved DNA-binding protein CbpA